MGQEENGLWSDIIVSKYNSWRSLNLVQSLSIILGDFQTLKAVIVESQNGGNLRSICKDVIKFCFFKYILLFYKMYDSGFKLRLKG